MLCTVWRETPKTYYEEIEGELCDRLGDTFDSLHFGRAYYQDILQANKARVWGGFPNDKDDVLGWPLAELSNEYAAVVEDKGGQCKWWNYWMDIQKLESYVAQSILG